MPKIQQTTTITIDTNTFEVASMSANVQQLVVYLDEWRQEEADQTSALLKTRAALNDIQATLLATIQDEAKAAQAAAVQEAPAPASAPVRTPKKTKVSKVTQ